MQYKHYYKPSAAFHETCGDLKQIDGQSLFVAIIIVISFGGIHLLAWNLPLRACYVQGRYMYLSANMTITCPTLYCSSHLPFIEK